MTKDELRNHCKKMCRRYSCIPDSSAYEEHKLVLDLLDTDDVLTKALVIQALEDVRAEIKNIPITEERDMATYWDCRDDVLEIIDRKIKEIKHENKI